MKSWLQNDTLLRQQHCLEALVQSNLIVNQNQRNRYREFCEQTFDQSHLEDALGIADGSSDQQMLINILNNYYPFDTYTLQQQCSSDLENKHLTGKNQRSIAENFYEYASSQAKFEQALGIASGSQGQIQLHSILNQYRPLASWVPTKGRGFKTFSDIIIEVKSRHALPPNQILHDILDHIQDRRENRNNFFHNQNQTGLTVNDEQCINAFCDLYDLMNYLFSGAIAQNATPVFVAQMAAIRAHKNIIHDAAQERKYNKILNSWENGENRRKLEIKGEVSIQFPNLAYEYCIIHYYPTAFYDALLQAGLVGV